MPAPLLSSVSPGDVSPLRDVDSVEPAQSSAPPDPDRVTTILAGLNDAITAGHHRLDPILGAITVAAQDLTGATGAAIAMWRDNAVVCRARCGETAPPLGARLSTESGISGECLRSREMQLCSDTEKDVRVDAEVCRQLGLRSIAALPIQGWRGINGILEVFSTAPQAFTEQHMSVLQRLAALAERARAAQPQGTFATSETDNTEDLDVGALLPASDRAGDVARVFLGSRRRPFILGGLSLLGLALLGFVIWLGWHTPDETSVKVQAASPPSKQVEAPRAPDNDPVWQLKPGGDVGIPAQTREDPVKLASKVDVISGPSSQLDRALAPAKPSAGLVVRGEPLASKVETSVTVEPPPMPASGESSSALSGVLDAPVSTPGLASPARISQGVTAGYILHRVAAVYPQQALLKRLQGKVVIQADIAEDGSVQNVKVVQGDATLSRAAVDAVQRWRYKPYELDGKPVRMTTTVVVNFTLP